MYRYMCTCARDGYGRAFGCTASHAHVGAICARRRCGRRDHVRMRGYVRRDMWPTPTSCMNMYMYISIDAKSGYINCKWVRVYVLAYACDRVRALTMR